MIISAVNGTVELKDQLQDYKYRGEALVHMNFLQFMLDTYDSSKEVDGNVNRPEQNDDNERTRGLGRPLST